MHTTRLTCRVCDSTDLLPLFSLGEQYVSNFVSKDEISSGPKVPIDIELCRNCTLVQAKHTAPQDFLYTRHYWYKSGTTATMRQALLDVAIVAQNAVRLEVGDIVLDIGSNDGTLLRSYTTPGIVRVGIEPATNLAEEGKRGIDALVNDFWPSASFEWMIGSNKPKIVTALGMFYDLEDPNPFVEAVARVLHPEGIFIAQLMCLKNMLNMSDLGNFAHEHLEFYSLRSLQYLFGRHGLTIFKVETNAVNGESYRLYARHSNNQMSVICPSVERALSSERTLDNPSVYRQFYSRMERNRARIRDFITEKVKAGKKVWAYGASTKGNVILQYFGLDSYLIEGIADKASEKWSKYTVGTGVPICSEEQFRLTKPDYALMLPYAFAKEFIEREKRWLQGGGTFIIPLPEMTLYQEWGQKENYQGPF